MQPSLENLMARFLSIQVDAHAKGLTTFDPAEVEPYEAGPVQPIDAAAAWAEALVALPGADALEPPPQWPQLVANHEPVVALPLCAANFPQLVRSFHALLHNAKLTDLSPTAGRAVAAPNLVAWADEVAAKKAFPQAILALGALRLAKRFDDADHLVAALENHVPTAWRDAWANERAALAWHRGKTNEAIESWRQQPASLAVSFNLGMAELFLGNAAAAREHLRAAAAQLPEESPWQHLARLYLALADLR